jgi:putative ABC transport system permease protein
VREIAILRTVGFGRLSLVWYLLGQAVAVTGTGFALSLATAALLLHGLRLSAVGVTITPVLDLRVAAAALVWSLALGLAAAAYPAARAARLGIAEALRSDSF